MKTSKILLITFLTFTTIFLSAQSSISGKVIDDNAQPVFFATIGLYNVSDSLLAKAISTKDDGTFTINKIKDGAYYLEASMLGLKTQRVEKLVFPRDNERTFDISLSQDSKILDGVEIKARVPLLEQKSDRLVVNVENNITSMNNSILDVMKQVPGVIVTGDKLRMAGQSNVTILIDGKTTRYMDMESLLKDMPGDNIKKVEVIHQPGAEFEASGTGPIINIILKKNSLYGTNGNVTVGLGKGENWKYKTGVNLSHRQGKLNVNAGVGFRDNPWEETLTIDREVQGDKYSQVGRDPNFSQTLRTNLSVDYDLTDKHRIGISSQYKFNWRDNAASNLTEIDYADPSATDIVLKTSNNEKRTWNLLTFNPYYTFDIDTNGQKLSLDYSYATFGRDGVNTLLNVVENTEEITYPDQQFDQSGDTEIMAAKLDYTLPINNNLSFSTGAKYGSADLDNNFQVFDEQQNGEFQKNNQQSNQFLLTEKIIGVYAKSTWKYGAWNGTLGLRYEDSKTEGKSVQVDTVLSRNINQFFPSLSLSREVYGPLKASIAYSYRIDRPRYSSLNPFRFYLDPFTFSRGNPMLQPALTHSTKFNLSYEGQPFFNVEYKDTKDAMVEVLEQNDASGQTNQVTLNLESFKTFNTSLFAPLSFIPKLDGYVGVIVNYSTFDSEINESNILRDRWSTTAVFSAQFTLPGDINSEVSGWYNSGELDGAITGEYLYGIDVGISKKILNDKGKISLGVDNLFYRPFYGNVNYSTLDVDIISDWDAPVINAQFSYKFGNQHMKKKSRAGGSGNDIIRRAEN